MAKCSFILVKLKEAHPLLKLVRWAFYVKKKQYPLLYDKEIGRYREKDEVSNAWNAGAKDLEFIENGKSNLFLFFMLYLSTAWDAGVFHEILLSLPLGEIRNRFAFFLKKTLFYNHAEYTN